MRKQFPILILFMVTVKCYGQQQDSVAFFVHSERYLGSNLDNEGNEMPPSYLINALCFISDSVVWINMSGGENTTDSTLGHILISEPLESFPISTNLVNKGDSLIFSFSTTFITKYECQYSNNDDTLLCRIIRPEYIELMKFKAIRND